MKPTTTKQTRRLVSCHACGNEYENNGTLCFTAAEKANAEHAALVAVAEAANECIQFGYIKHCEARTALVSALADLTEIRGRKAVQS